jgi:hypothetical protein
MDSTGITDEPKVRRLNTARRRRAVLSAAVVVLVLGISLASYLAIRPRTAPLLPVNIIAQVSGFTPYFYSGTIPAGFTAKTADISYEQGILLIPLVHPSGTNLVITEQSLPADVTPESIQQNGTPVKTHIGNATINDIEGRLVGTLIPSDKRTLILITATDKSNKPALTSLLQQLTPIRK